MISSSVNPPKPRNKATNTTPRPGGSRLIVLMSVLVFLFAVAGIWVYSATYGGLRCGSAIAILEENPPTVEAALKELADKAGHPLHPKILPPKRALADFAFYGVGEHGERREWIRWRNGAALDRIAQVHVIMVDHSYLFDDGDVGASFLLFEDSNGNLIGWAGPEKCGG